MLYLYKVWLEFMDQLFKLPDSKTDELNIAARVNFYLAFGFITFSLVFTILALLFAPELVPRSLVIAPIIVPTSVVIIALTRMGRVRTASRILIVLFWALITTSAVTAGGISAPIMFGFFIVVIFSGLVADRKTSIIIGGFCILTVMAIAFAQTRGFLPTSTGYSPMAKASILTLFLSLAILLQNANSTNTRILLKQTQTSEDRYRSLLENIPVTTYINNLDPEAPTEYIG